MKFKELFTEATIQPPREYLSFIRLVISKWPEVEITDDHTAQNYTGKLVGMSTLQFKDNKQFKELEKILRMPQFKKWELDTDPNFSPGRAYVYWGS